MIAGVLILEYALRPLAVYTSGKVGWDPSTLLPIDGLNSSSLVNASFLAMFGVGGFWVAFLATRHGRKHLSDDDAEAPLHQDSDAPVETPRRVRFRVRTFVGLGVAVTLSALLATRYGQVGDVFTGQLGRTRYGSGYLYALVNLAGVTALTVLARIRFAGAGRMPRRAVIGISLALVVFTGIHFLILGDRSQLLVVLIAAGVLAIRPRKRLSIVALAAIAVVLAVVLSAYRIATREINYASNRQATAGDLIGDATNDPLGTLMRGDVSAYDKIVYLEYLAPEPEQGRTYAAAFLLPIPGKADLDGGNRAFTRIAIPQRYYANRTFEGASLLGEGYLNFGTTGLLLAAAVVGSIYGFIWRRRNRSSSWALCFALAIGAFPTLIRADLFNLFALMGNLLIVAIIANILVGKITPVDEATIAIDSGAPSIDLTQRAPADA